MNAYLSCVGVSSICSLHSAAILLDRVSKKKRSHGTSVTGSASGSHGLHSGSLCVLPVHLEAGVTALSVEVTVAAPTDTPDSDNSMSLS